jgi:hypothetical protein
MFYINALSLFGRRTGLPLHGWEQLANAVSMIVFNLYVWSVATPMLDDDTRYAFDVEIIRWFTLLHCPCSVSYHVTLMWRSRHACSGLERDTWTRALDMGAIHACCAAYGLALSHGAWPWLAAANALWNCMCVGRMLRRAATGGAAYDFGDDWRVTAGIMLYPTGMLLRNRLADFSYCWLLGLAAWGLQNVSPFGHAASRIPMAMATAILLKSASEA